TFSNLSIDKVGTGYTLTASASGLTGDTSSSFNITTSGATALAFSLKGTDTALTNTTAPALMPSAGYANGNLVTSSSASVTLAIGTNPSSGTLSGTHSPYTTLFRSTFSNLSIDKVGTGYTLTASASGLTGDTSSSFNVTSSGVLASIKL